MQNTWFLVKPSFFNGKAQISHPEIELWTDEISRGKPFLEPVYSTTEKLKTRGLNGRQIGKLTETLFEVLGNSLQEILPAAIQMRGQYIGRQQAFRQIHFPPSVTAYEQALARLKFDEFFISQVRLGLTRLRGKSKAGAWCLKKWVSSLTCFILLTYHLNLQVRKKG